METTAGEKRSSYRKKWSRPRECACHCCGVSVRFCWQCRCGFRICQDCMTENLWGMSCNGITWECPDCGGQNGLGNQ
ncbi:MAG: hypothetical protein C4530_23735 [Desulfobacteraceae bacterium]|nr:MAG: hypothetical protein C4530_23735 [Desulfobacteraceae bacterium]